VSAPQLGTTAVETNNAEQQPLRNSAAHHPAFIGGLPFRPHENVLGSDAVGFGSVASTSRAQAAGTSSARSVVDIGAASPRRAGSALAAEHER